MAAGDSKTPGRVQRKKARRVKVEREDLCIAGDGEPVHARGLCPACYQEARTRVNAGETTWQKLETMGLARPSSGRASETAFAQKFARLKKNGK